MAQVHAEGAPFPQPPPPDAAAVAAVLALVPAAERTPWGDDPHTVARYLRAVGGADAKAAARRLRATLAWRAATRPEAVACAACAAAPHSHYMHVCAADTLGRPTIYSCMELAACRDLEANRQHMIATFEHAVRCMPPGVHSWVWLCDFHGFSVRDMDPRIARAFLDIAAAHYPERLGLFVILDAPAAFQGLWKALGPFVDPVTKRKVVFASSAAPSRAAGLLARAASSFKGGGDGGDGGAPPPPPLPPSSLRAVLDAHFDAETAAWLVAEVADNRVKRAAAGAAAAAPKRWLSRAASAPQLAGAAAAAPPPKHYPQPDLAALAAGAGAEALEAARAARLRLSACGSHDNLGAPGHLAALAGRPERLPTLPGVGAA